MMELITMIGPIKDKDQIELMENLIDIVVQYTNYKMPNVLILLLMEKDTYISQKKMIVAIVVMLLTVVEFLNQTG